MRRWQLVLLFTVFLTGCGYRDFQQLEADRHAAWQALVPLLQQRTALVANLLTSARVQPGVDAAQLSRLAEARARVLALPPTPDLPDDAQLPGHATAQIALTNALAPVLQQVRRAPGLLPLANQLEGLDNRIAVARNSYDLATQRHNALLERFPSSLTARIMGLQARPAWTATAP